MTGKLWHLLDDSSMKAIADAAMRLVTRTGVRVEHEQMLRRLEMYRGIGRLYEPVKANAATLAEDLIDQIARMPGGTFADTDHTLEHFREQWMPRWLERSSWRGEAQEQQREHKMLAAIDDYCRSAVARYEAPTLDEAKLQAAAELLERAQRELAGLGQRA